MVMKPIRLLSEQLINRIAAGEVVERPASILKELIENSLDAEATVIRIQAEGGGRRHISVADNGHGMGPDDLLLSVERHSTSKLAEDTDLLAISSLGFRGEALASIGAVSRLIITSSPENNGDARRIRMSGGRVLAVENASRDRGATVEVNDLFYNVPARRKFLKSVETEAAHLAETAARYALGRPGLRLVYQHNSQTVLATSPDEDSLTRVGRVLGRETARHMFAFEDEMNRISLSGFLSRAELTRSRPNLYLYVNGRPVKDALLTRAVLDAYRGRLMSGRSPVAVIFLTVDPQAVDVNVHPAKAQVRFRSPGEVMDAALTILTRALRANDRTLVAPRPALNPPGTVPAPYPTPSMTDTFSLRDGGLYAEFPGTTRASQPFSFEPGQYSHASPAAAGNFPGDAIETGLRPIGQLSKAYILAQGPDGLYIVDQHAAHERILYERLASEMASGNLTGQSLLLPLTFDLSPQEVLGLTGIIDKLSRFGFDLAPFGGRTFVLKAVPAVLGDQPLETIMTEIIGELADLKPEAGLDRLEEALLSSLACHAAVKAGQEMTLAEMDRLLIELAETNVPGHCPHGRPLIFRLGLTEIEKKFKRV